MSRLSNTAASAPQTVWRYWLEQRVALAQQYGLDLALASLGAILLLAQPDAPLALGLALLVTPWSLRLATAARFETTPLDLPLGLYLASAGLGLLATSDPPTAAIRWWGLVAIAGLSLLLARHQLGRPGSLASLWLTLAFGLGGAVAVLVLTQGRIARGPLGQLLEPWLAWFEQFPPMTEPVMQTNTRFIVNYNGFGDMGMLVVLAGIALASHARAWRLRWGSLLLVGLVALLVVATGGRGSLLGLGSAILTLLVVQQVGKAVAAERPRGSWTRLRQPIALAIGLALAGGALAASGIIDKGFEGSSVAGRIVFWRDLLAILGDYGLTGLGLGMQSPLNAIVAYGITARWDDMVYAHNMFVQTYLEQGPLGLVALCWLLAVPFIVGLRALRHLQPAQQSAIALGLAVVVGLTVHGLTDQVPTSNVGTLMLVGAASLVVAAASCVARRRAATALGWRGPGLALALSVGLGLLISQPRGLASVAANLGAVEVARATNLDAYDAFQRRAHAATGRWLLEQALALSPRHPPALRQLARLDIAGNDLAAASGRLEQVTGSPHLTPFDAVQVGRLYYAIGFLDEGRYWTRWGYEASGRNYRAAAYEYDRLLLDQDWRVRTLVEQAEDRRDERRYAEALPLFEQALHLAPQNRYLQDQVEEVRRDLAKQQQQE